MPTHDLVTHHGGVGDGQRVTLNCSITSGSNVFLPSSNIFSSGDIGKTMFLVAGGGFVMSQITITAYNAGTGAITLSDVAPSTLTNTSTDVLWGTDNTAAFADYATWAQAQVGLVILTIPAGRFCWKSTFSNRPNLNVKQVRWQGAGPTTILSQFLQNQMYFGGNDPVVHKGLTISGGNSARIDTALAGATTFHLKDTATYGSRVTAGLFCFVTGYDMQGVNNSAYGYPPNPFFYEHNQVATFNAGTGIGTFVTPLTQTYKDTWPNWNSGSSGEADPGGPATIYICDSSYDTAVELNDFILDNPYNQSVCHGRSAIQNRLVMTGTAGLYPTQNGYFEANFCDYSSTGLSLEMDKINDTVVFNDCIFDILDFQSASPNVCYINRGSANRISGSPKRLIIDGLAFTGPIAKFQAGAASFGRTDEVQMSNCTGLKEFATGGASQTGDHGGGFSATMTMSGGVLSWAKTINDGTGAQENPARCMVPGTWVLLDFKYLVQIIDAWEDGTTVFFSTTLNGSWPFTFTTLNVHPAPRFTMRNCTGTAPELEDWNQAPARIPLYSYSKRTVVGGPSSGTALPASAKPLLWGKLATEKINVTVPYVAGPLTVLDNQFTNRPYIKRSDYSSGSDFGNVVNMAIAGERVIRSATTATNAKSGDTLMNMTSAGEVNFWNAGNSSPVFSANVSNGETPTATIEYVMDQGIPPVVPTAVMRLRFRLHA